MDKNLNSINNARYIIGSLIIVVGLCLSLFSSFFSSFFSVILASLILVGGVCLIVNSFTVAKYSKMPIFRTVIGFLVLAFGAYSFMNPFVIMSFTSSIIGFIALIVGCYKLANSVYLTKMNQKPILSYIETFINIAFAMFMFFFPIDGNSIIILILGIYFIYFGITFIVAIKQSSLFFEKFYNR